MKTQWEHYPETLTNLETYRTVIDGITLDVSVIEYDFYVWSTNTTGPRRRSGDATSLGNAMTDAIKSVRYFDTLVMEVVS